VTRWFAIFAVAWVLCVSPTARANCIDDVASARRIGAGEFCVLGFCVYDAELWASRPLGAVYTPSDTLFDSPFVLSIKYRHDVTRERLVSTGMDEIERLAPSPLSAATRDAWQANMTEAFIDVSGGDVICGVYLPGKGARFYANGRFTAAIADPAFAVAFFNIWLDPRARGTKVRRQLLGEVAGP
jgi:hypothetical protein